MVDNRGIDTEVGSENRAHRAIWKAIEGLRSERRAPSTTVGSGGLEVVEGGEIRVLDGGNIRVSEGGGIEVMHVDGETVAIRLGDQAVEAFAPDGSQVFTLQMTPSTWFPSFGKALQATGFDHLFLQAGSGSSLSLGGAIFPGVIVDLAGAENFRLVDLPTTSASANMVHNASFISEVARSTSSRRYKQDIADADIEPTAVLKMRPRSWRDKSEVEKNPDTSRRYVGFVAEELHDLGLNEFVTYDDDNNPDAIAYDRLCVALLSALRWVAQQARARTEALEAKVAAQQSQIDDLAAAVAALTTKPI